MKKELWSKAIDNFGNILEIGEPFAVGDTLEILDKLGVLGTFK